MQIGRQRSEQSIQIRIKSLLLSAATGPALIALRAPQTWASPKAAGRAQEPGRRRPLRSRPRPRPQHPQDAVRGAAVCAVLHREVPLKWQEGEHGGVRAVAAMESTRASWASVSSQPWGETSSLKPLVSNESVHKNLSLLLEICLGEGKDVFLGSLVSDEQFGSDSSSSSPSPSHHGASQIHQDTPKTKQCH